MGNRYEIRFAGSGGQGVILAAVIVGEAAALFEDGLSVVQSQSYGPEARGGKSKARLLCLCFYLCSPPSPLGRGRGQGWVR